MDTITLSALPAPLAWLNTPLEATAPAADALRIVAGPQTDWFNDPAGGAPKGNAPVALFSPAEPTFSLSARVTVGFAATYDAGVLFLHASAGHWAKLCFEVSPQGRPGVVSVVTRGTSDDCNSVMIDGDTVHLRLYCQGDVAAFHYSVDGRWWHFVRLFTLGPLAKARAGFSAQSPTGAGCAATFAGIRYRPAPLADLRDGS
jgi:regulation of enolase protein 1 (concanavalin A-like superfamily)